MGEAADKAKKVEESKRSEDDKKAIDFLMSLMGKYAVNAALSEKAKELENL